VNYYDTPGTLLNEPVPNSPRMQANVAKVRLQLARLPKAVRSAQTPLLALELAYKKLGDLLKRVSSGKAQTPFVQDLSDPVYAFLTAGRETARIIGVALQSKNAVEQALVGLKAIEKTVPIEHEGDSRIELLKALFDLLNTLIAVMEQGEPKGEYLGHAA
jgi:hypothetical protein